MGLGFEFQTIRCVLVLLISHFHPKWLTKKISEFLTQTGSMGSCPSREATLVVSLIFDYQKKKTYRIVSLNEKFESEC